MLFWYESWICLRFVCMSKSSTKRSFDVSNSVLASFYPSHWHIPYSFARFPLYRRVIFAHPSSNKRVLFMGNINSKFNINWIIQYCCETTKCSGITPLIDSFGVVKVLLLHYKSHYAAAMARRVLMTRLFDFGEKCYVKWHVKKWMSAIFLYFFVFFNEIMTFFVISVPYTSYGLKRIIIWCLMIYLIILRDKSIQERVNLYVLIHFNEKVHKRSKLIEIIEASSQF